MSVKYQYAVSQFFNSFTSIGHLNLIPRIVDDVAMN